MSTQFKNISILKHLTKQSKNFLFQTIQFIQTVQIQVIQFSINMQFSSI